MQANNDPDSPPATDSTASPTNQRRRATEETKTDTATERASGNGGGGRPAPESTQSSDNRKQHALARLTEELCRQPQVDCERVLDALEAALDLGLQDQAREAFHDWQKSEDSSGTTRRCWRQAVLGCRESLGWFLRALGSDPDDLVVAVSVSGVPRSRGVESQRPTTMSPRPARSSSAPRCRRPTTW